MQLGLHSDRMTVDIKNYNVETKNKYLYSYLHRVWLFRLICHQYYIWKKLISKKQTYQLCKTKGCEHRFRKVCRRFFLVFSVFFFFSHIVIFFEKIEIKKIYIFSSFFASSSPIRTPRGLCRALEKLGEAKTAWFYKNAYNKNEIFDNITNLVTNNLVESSSYRSTSNFFDFFFDFLKIFFENFFDEE